jgi:hypothetical protein
MNAEKSRRERILFVLEWGGDDWPAQQHRERAPPVERQNVLDRLRIA